MFFPAHRDLKGCRKKPGTPGRSSMISGISYEKIVQKKDPGNGTQSARSARKCRAGIRTDARAQSNDGDCSMKHDIGEPEDKAYRIIPDSNAIIHDLPRMTAGAEPARTREPGVNG